MAERPGDAPATGGPPFDPGSGWAETPGMEAAPDTGLAHYHDILTPDLERQVSLRFRALSFFPGVRLVRVVPRREGETAAAYALWSGHGFHWLRGTSDDIFAAIEREEFRLSDQTVLEYHGFFCFFIHGDEGPFRVIASSAALDGFGGTAFGHVPPERMRALVEPPRARRLEGAGWAVEATVLYGNTLFRAAFRVSPAGQVEMVGDEPLVEGVPVPGEQVAGPDRTGWPGDAASAHELLGPLGLSAYSRFLPPHASERRLEWSVVRELVRIQLLDALRGGGARPLFEAGARADDDTVLAEFARFALAHHPLVVLESTTPFIETTVWELLRQAGGGERTVREAVEVDGDGAVKRIEDGDVLLVSLHRFPRLRRPRALAHRLGVTEALALVGCDTLQAVPEPLARIADVTLRLDGMNPDLFRRLFRRLFACDWPRAWDNPDPAWMHYVGPPDCFGPLRDMIVRRGNGTGSGWSPEDALAAIRRRVQARLAAVSGREGPALSRLHGLGEARRVVADLVADIRDALAGELPWEAVDRGVLLAGAPGTGKTTLARAVAREAGVRFLHASGARWISGTRHLGEHLGRIRATFAEARRFAPCILFIDEFDSIGHRGQFSGSNRQYAVEVVNALLQEIQSFDSERPVFVMGATNHADRIDPALLRAGRLDQVVSIPRPHRRALVRIFELYLQPYAAARRLAEDVDLEALAALALGATGADVERCVRDAVRRARAEGGRIHQRHLAAAVTRAPRRAGGAVPAGAGLRRTAVHEAGHAVALLTCRHFAVELTMVSIVPRADGSLGFTGLAQDPGHVLTRAACLEYLQVLLAGRAAEELVYGPEAVSSGAGGDSPTSDLAQATGWAVEMLCRLGLDPDGPLLWREQPETEADVERLEDLLSRSHAAVLQRLQAHRALLDGLVEALVARQELSAAEVAALAERHAVPAAGGA